jgi:hypothetical protein
LGPFPEGTGFADFLHDLDHLFSIFEHVGDIILIHAPFEVGPGEKLDHIGQGCDSFLAAFGKGIPMANMLFRPEEVHGASGVSWIFKPFPKRNRDIGHVSRGVFIQYFAVSEHHSEWFTAIETRKIYGYRLARKEPADRQRFKSSLAEPFLLPIYGDMVLGGKIIERGEGNNEISSRGEPSWYPGDKEFAEHLFTFSDGKPEWAGQFRVEWRLASFHHASHNDMECSIQNRGFSHYGSFFPVTFQSPKTSILLYGTYLEFWRKSRRVKNLQGDRE